MIVSPGPATRQHFAVEGEVGFACRDDEPLLLVGVDVLGDHAAWHAAPVEADELPVGVLADGREV